MELHQIYYVLKVAEFLHFTKAAEALSIAQPSLSQQITKLENELGTKLFLRKTRSVELTPAGKDFIVHAKKISGEIKNLNQTMSKYTQPEIKNINIGMITVSRLGVPNIVNAFQNEFPNIKANLSESHGCYELVKELINDQIDVAFFIPTTDVYKNPNFYFKTLIKGNICVILNKNHPLATKESVSIFEIAQENSVSTLKTYSIFEDVTHAFMLNGLELKISKYCVHITTAFDFVAKGLGISFISSQFIQIINNPNLIALPLKPELERNLSIAYLKRKSNLPVIKKFSDYVMRSLNEED